MKRLTLSSLTLLFCSTPSLAADLYYGPTGYIEAPPVVVERRIIERRYYEPAPVYSAPRAYYEPRVYAADTYYDRPSYGYRHVYGGRPHYYFSHGRYWRHHHHSDW